MHVIIDHGDLSPILSRALLSTARKPVNPVLGWVRLTAADGHLTITTTDTEQSYEARLACNVRAPGSVCTDAATLAAQVGLMSGPVELQVKHQRLHVTAEGKAARLRIAPAEDFPLRGDVAVLDDPSVITLDAQALAAMCEAVGFAICRETGRGINGAHIEPVTLDGAPGVRMAATDGHRLAYHQRPCAGVVDLPDRMLLPTAALAAMVKILDGRSDIVTLGFGENGAVLTAGAESYAYRLIDGELPDYRRVLPPWDKMRRAAVVDVADLRSALRPVLALQRAATGTPTTCLDFRVDTTTATMPLTISARDLDHGEAEATVEVELVGEGLAIGVNARYLDEVLAHLSGTIEIGMGDALSPIVIRPKGDTSTLMVCMPMRLD